MRTWELSRPEGRYYVRSRITESFKLAVKLLGLVTPREEHSPFETQGE